MAITQQQRKDALDLLLRNYGNDQKIAVLLPGVTSAQLLNALEASLGAGVNAQLTAVLNNAVTLANQQITRHANATTVLQGNIAEWTVV